MKKTTWRGNVMGMETIASIGQIHFDWIGATIVVALLVLVGLVGHKLKWWKL